MVKLFRPLEIMINLVLLSKNEVVKRWVLPNKAEKGNCPPDVKEKMLQIAE